MEGLSPVRFGTASLVTTSLGPNDPKVGDRARIGDEDYLFVYNTGGASINVGHGVTVSSVTGYSVTVSTTVSTMVGIGVCKHATITTAAFGWVVTRGWAKAQTSNAVAATDCLTLGLNGRFENASGLTGPVYGRAMAAIASGVSGDAYFQF